MSELGQLVAIDVGSASVRVVVATDEASGPQPRGCGQAFHDGAKKGLISNIEAVSEAIREAAEEAEAMASLPVTRALVGLGGPMIRGMEAVAQTPITGREGTVAPADQRNALQRCSRISFPADYRVLDIIPSDYEVDGQGGLEDPVGMPGHSLSAIAWVLYAHRTHVDAVTKAVNHAGIEVDRLIHEPVAAAAATLSEEERELGCLLLDIGESSSEWLLVTGDRIVATGSSPVAGRSFSRDLTIVLRTPHHAAETLKRGFSLTRVYSGQGPEGIDLPVHGSQQSQLWPATHVADILAERGRDLFTRVHRELVACGAERAPQMGLVMTGDGALLDGLPGLAEEIFGLPARLGKPIGLEALDTAIGEPGWATAWGLIAHECNIHRRHAGLTRPATEGFLIRQGERLKRLFGELFGLSGGES